MIVHKSKGTLVLFVGFVRLLLLYFPCRIIHGREKGIGMFGRGMYVREIKAVGKRKCFSINAFATDDKHLFCRVAGIERSLQTSEDFAVGLLRIGIAREHNVSTIGKRSLWQ